MGVGQCLHRLITDAQDASQADGFYHASGDQSADVALADVEHIGDVLGRMPAALVLVGLHNVTVVMVRTTRTLWEGIFEGLVNL